MPRVEPRPVPVVSPGRNAATRQRLAAEATEFVVNGPETWVPIEAAPGTGDPDSIAAWALRKGAPPEPIPREAD